MTVAYSLDKQALHLERPEQNQYIISVAQFRPEKVSSIFRNSEILIFDEFINLFVTIRCFQQRELVSSERIFRFENNGFSKSFWCSEIPNGSHKLYEHFYISLMLCLDARRAGT